MRSYIFVMLIAFQCVVVVSTNHAQNTWNRMYSESQRPEAISAALLEGDDLRVGRFFADSVGNGQVFSKMCISRIGLSTGAVDIAGCIDYFPDSTYLWSPYNIFKSADGDLLILVLHKRLGDPPTTPTKSYGDGAVISMDINGNVEWRLDKVRDSLPFGGDFFAPVQLALEDSIYTLFSHEVDDNRLNKVSIFELNRTGQILDYDHLNLFALAGSGRYVLSDIRKYEEGYFAFVYYGDPTDLTSTVFIVEFDQFWNIRRYLEFPDEYDYFGSVLHNNLRLTNNGGFAWIHSAQYLNSSTRYPALFVYSDDFEEQWRFVIESLNVLFQQFAICANGDYLLATVDLKRMIDGERYRVPVLYRISAAGDVLWERVIIPPEGIVPLGGVPNISGLFETEEGNIVGVGSVKDENGLQKSWAFSLLPNGCFTEDCSSGSVIVSTSDQLSVLRFSDHDIVVYPNPAKDYVTVQSSMLAGETTNVKWTGPFGSQILSAEVHWSHEGTVELALPDSEHRALILQVEIPSGELLGIKVLRRE